MDRAKISKIVLDVISNYAACECTMETTMAELELSSFEKFCMITELEEQQLHVNLRKVADAESVADFMEAVE